MRALRLLAAAVATITPLAACSDEAPRDEAAYCGQVASHLTDLNSPVIADAIDITQVLISWREVARSAPLAVAAEWNTMIEAMETAVTVDPNDPESVQKVADTARASEQSADRVISYTQQRCGLTIGGG